MPSCEMCGKEVPRTRMVTIGGTVLGVCNDCARFGDEVRKEEVEAPPTGPAYSESSEVAQQRVPPASPRSRPRDVLAEGTLELVEDYPKRIREARQRLGWKQDDLGKQINEKRSVISHLESGETRPDPKLVKKLETVLDVKLLEPVAFQMDTSKKGKKTGGVTLGDLIRMSK